MKATLGAAAVAVCLTAWLPNATALPAYSTKEGKPCGYCHVNANGTGGVNARGKYYASHNHSLAGYTEDSAGTPDKPKKTGPPAYVSLWKMEMVPGVTRVASAILTDDKKPRLLVLDASNKLAIKDVTGKDPAKDEEIDLGSTGQRLAVGRFAAGKPAVVAVPGAIWYRDGDKYANKKVPKLTDVNGSVRYLDGAEAIFHLDGSERHAWSVDLSKDGDAMLSETKELVMPEDSAGIYQNVALRAGDDLLSLLGLPEPARKAGVIGLIDPREAKKMYAWAPIITDSASEVIMVDVASLADAANAKAVWRSPKTPGRLVDVFAGPDPKGGKAPGILVLTATGADGKGRSLEFFALD